MSTAESQAVRPATIPGPDPAPRPPRTPFPPGACDCHSHVFGPQTEFPYLPNTAYIPPDASPRDYARMLGTIGCQRAVIVQPSIYGTDNRCMVAALTSGLFDFRGVAVVDQDVGEQELEALHRAGVRGVRINLSSKTPGIPLEQAPKLAARIKPFGWHLQFFLRIGQVPSLEQVIARIPVPCVIDHFGHAPAAGGAGIAGVRHPAQTCPARACLVQADRAVPDFHAVAALSGCSAAGAGAGRRCAGPLCVGYRLAASEYGLHAERRRSCRCAR